MRKSNGQWWSVFLACRPIDNKFENTGRETFLLPVTWSSDGFPYMLEGNEEVPRIVQMEGINRDSSVTFGNFDKYDAFDSSKLGMEWMTLRGDANGLYSLTDNPGFLDLKCSKVASNELKCPAYISRRLQHHKFECTTSMYYTPHSETESAGMLMMKDETHQYLFVVERVGGVSKISLKIINKDKYEYICSKSLAINDQPTKLKIVSDGNQYSFYYTEGDSNWQLLIDGIDAAYLSTATSYGFTGTNVGLYASDKK
jgi:xylan 1,4-beta-xylosidase